jgi:hypothetical protein
VETEIAVTLNAFKIPTALIADALDGFHLSHKLCEALWTAGPLDGERWTDAQRVAYEIALTRSLVLRDQRQRLATRSFSDHQDSVTGRGFTAEEQHDALRLALRWRRFLEQFAANAQPAPEGFFLVVDPAERTSNVVASVDLAADLVGKQRLLTDAVIVVRLAAVLGFLARLDNPVRLL